MWEVNHLCSLRGHRYSKGQGSDVTVFPLAPKPLLGPFIYSSLSARGTDQLMIDWPWNPYLLLCPVFFCFFPSCNELEIWTWAKYWKVWFLWLLSYGLVTPGSFLNFYIPHICIFASFPSTLRLNLKSFFFISNSTILSWAKNFFYQHKEW